VSAALQLEPSYFFTLEFANSTRVLIVGVFGESCTSAAGAVEKSISAGATLVTASTFAA
jgi:hypothetical protein